VFDPMKPSGIHHVAICVRDEDEALAFYRDALGCAVLPRPDFGFGGYWLDAGGQQVHLMHSEQVPAGGQHFAIRVDDLDAAVADLRARGVAVDTIPHLAGAGHQAFLHDPSGNMVELNQPDAAG
jgi:catechol 2,3-dioxygenase-like lactoylglutathione lyase family enzyme